MKRTTKYFMLIFNIKTDKDNTFVTPPDII
jgi:hypothetical protein